MFSGCCCFSNFNISQGSVAMHLRGGGIFYYRFTTNLLVRLSVTEFWKSVSLLYRQKIWWYLFFWTRCILVQWQFFKVNQSPTCHTTVSVEALTLTSSLITSHPQPDYWQNGHCSFTLANTIPNKPGNQPLKWFS